MLVKLRERVSALERPGGGAPAKPHRALCTVHQGADGGIPANTDLYALSDWVASDDPDGIVSTDSNNRRTITIAQPGRYLLVYRVCMQPTSSAGEYVCWVTLNGGASIARDSRVNANAGADGATPTAVRLLRFNTGDVIRWGMWASTGTTVRAAQFGAPTEISLHQIGAR